MANSSHTSCLIHFFMGAVLCRLVLSNRLRFAIAVWQRPAAIFSARSWLSPTLQKLKEVFLRMMSTLRDIRLIKIVYIYMIIHVINYIRIIWVSKIYRLHLTSSHDVTLPHCATLCLSMSNVCPQSATFWKPFDKTESNHSNATGSAHGECPLAATAVQGRCWIVSDMGKALVWPLFLIVFECSWYISDILDISKKWLIIWILSLWAPKSSHFQTPSLDLYQDRIKTGPSKALIPGDVFKFSGTQRCDASEEATGWCYCPKLKRLNAYMVYTVFCIIASRECQHFGRECRFLCWDMLGPFCTFCKCLARRWSKLFIACRLPQAARDRERPLNNATVIYSAITYCLHAFTSRLNPFNRWGVPNVVSSSPPGILESPTLGAGQSCKTETPSLSVQWQV